MTKMKNLLNIVLLGAILAITFGLLSASDGGRIKVYLINECSTDARFKVASPGSSTHYTVGDGEKKPFSFLEGTKVYDTDGNVIVEVESSDEGKEFVVCD